MILAAVFAETVRQQGHRMALRYQTPSGWHSLSWAEVETEVAQAAWLFQQAPPRHWQAADPLALLVGTLALLHLGKAAEEGLGRGSGSCLERAHWQAVRPPRHSLLKWRTELRDRDEGLIQDGRMLSQAQVLEQALAWKVMAGPEEILVSAHAQRAGLAAACQGMSLVFGPPSLLPSLSPHAWLAQAAHLDALSLGPSRAGPLGGLLRKLGRAPTVVGNALAQVWLAEPLPPSAQALQQRGIRVSCLAS